MASTDKIEAFLAESRNVVVAGIRRSGRHHARRAARDLDDLGPGLTGVAGNAGAAP